MYTNMKTLDNNQVQVILTGTFGDGSIRTTMSTGTYKTNCKMRGHLEFKKSLLGELAKEIKYIEKNGFSQTYIWELRTSNHLGIKEVHELSLIEKLESLDDLGIALWMYDDGSLHKRLNFYNLNTHTFNEEDNKTISKFLNKRLGIYSRVMTERKKDGRVFYYIYIPPCGGAYKLSNIMEKYLIEDYKYKIYPKDVEKELKTLHEYVDCTLTSGTEEHYKEVTSLRLRLSRYRIKNKDLTVEEFLESYVNKPKWVKKNNI